MMPTERLDIKTVRYDKLSDEVLFKGRKAVLAVTKDALEALFNRELSPDEAVLKAVEEAKRLTRLAEIIPADDGRVLVTKDRLLSDGQFQKAETSGAVQEHGSS